MKERMNKCRAGTDLSNVALHEQGNALEQYFTGQEIRVYFAILLKAIMTVNTATQQYLKGTGESMLVYARRAIQPEIDIDVESRSDEESNGRITELAYAVVLQWQIWSSVHPANDFPWINLSSQIRLSERLGRDLRKCVLVVVLLSPPAFYQRAKLLELSHKEST